MRNRFWKQRYLGKGAKMKRFLVIILAATMVVSLILMGCAAPATPPAPKPAATPTPAAHPEVKLDIWAGPFGGTPYVTGFAFMDILNKTHPWLRGSIIESKGGWDNALNSDKDKAKMPYVFVSAVGYDILDGIVNGAKTWTDAGRTPGLPGDRLVIATAVVSAQLVVTFDPKLKSGKDLIGKKVAGWTRGSGAYGMLAQMFDQWGITEKDLRSYDGMELKAKNDALSDGLVDAIQLSEPFVPDKPNLMTSSLSELLTNQKPLYYIPIAREEAQTAEAQYKAQKKYFAPWMELPAGHFVKSWPKGGTTFAIQTMWVYKEMPEEIQYEIAKTLIEKSDDIAAYGGAAISMLPSVLVGAMPVTSESQIAPGALKYYKEKGLLTKYPPPFIKK
jgi:TRAP transporter TAXI family solute receptor